ncbi:MAG: hypothetical protein U0W40_19845 [Acidimicrobiia bacterium]
MFAVVFAVVLVVLLGFAALLVDLWQLRTTSRYEQSYVDLAALSAGRQLATGDAVAACQAAIKSLNTNDGRLSPVLTPSTFCATIPTSCTNATVEAKPTQTVGDVTVSIHYRCRRRRSSTRVGRRRPRRRHPVSADAGAREHPRQGHVLAHLPGHELPTPAAPRRCAANGTGSPPALWVLDPTGCVPLKVDGGSQVTVGTASIQGVITVDSDGTTCSGGSSTISATGAGTIIQAVGPPTGAATGQINLVALPPGQTTCTVPACDPLDVSAGRITPQPQYGSQASRAYIDWKYNCKDTYPTFHGVFVAGCPNTSGNGGTSYAYIDNLKTAIGTSGTPAGYTMIGGPGNNKDCAPAASVVYPQGNYFVNCTRGNNGFVVNSGVTIEFQGGNVVFADNVTVSNGGTLKFNTANTNASLSAACKPPTVQTPCTTASSQTAAFVFMRGDETSQFSTSGTGTIVANHTFVYGGSGSVAFSGAPPAWTAPTEGPFAALAYWTDMSANASNAQKSSFTITGGSGANLTGVFFTPEAAPFKLAGGGNWGQQHAQFIAFQLTVTGGGVLTMAPDPTFPTPPLKKGSLIR